MARDNIVCIKVLSRKKDKFMFAQKETAPGFEKLPTREPFAKMVNGEWIMVRGY
jgi:hypothetical protein